MRFLRSSLLAAATLAIAFPAFAGDPIPDNVAQKTRARDAACTKISEIYRTLMTATIPGGRDLGVSGTVFRQNTLQRLLTIAWTQNCDMGPILQAELTYIENVLTVSSLNTPQQRTR